MDEFWFVSQRSCNDDSAVEYRRQLLGPRLLDLARVNPDCVLTGDRLPQQHFAAGFMPKCRQKRRSSLEEWGRWIFRVCADPCQQLVTALQSSFDEGWGARRGRWRYFSAALVAEMAAIRNFRLTIVTLHETAPCDKHGTGFAQSPAGEVDCGLSFVLVQAYTS